MNRKVELRDFIRETFLFGKERAFSDTASLQEEGLVDSTGLMALVAFVERTYNIVVKDEELLPRNFDTIERLDEFITSKLKCAGPAAQ